MRNILFGMLLLAACASPEKEETTIVETGPTEWLVFEGESEKPTIVLISGDEEYRSEEAMPQMAKILSSHHGFNCVVLFAQDPENPGVVDPNYGGNIPGIEALDSADMAIFFTRFRALPDDQMRSVDSFLKAGKPLIGIRTATHAFHFKDSTSSFFNYGNYYGGDDAWNGGFGRLVLGENWVAHHGHHGEQSTRGYVDPESDIHPVLTSINADSIWGPTDVYAVRLPMQESVTPILMGKTVDRVNPRDDNDSRLGMRPTDEGEPDEVERNGLQVDLNNPMMPIVWTKNYQLPDGQPGRSVTSTIGASVDMLSADVRRLMVNSCYWLLEMEIPETADVSIVGSYNPSPFAFHDDDYWDNKALQISDLK